MLDDAKVGPGMPIWWPALARAGRRVLGGLLTHGFVIG
jgi:hypothetical protein